MAYFDNIAAEEDIEEAVEKVEKILGKSGRMLPTGKNVQYNTLLSTKKHGKLWYGDMLMNVNKIEESEEYDKVLKVLELFVDTNTDWSLATTMHTWLSVGWTPTKGKI